VPGFGWAIKGGIAYTGTIAMGMAAIAYFEDGADLGGVVKALTERAGEAVSRVKGAHAIDHGAYLDVAHLSAPAALPSSEARIEPGPDQPTLLDVAPAAPTLMSPPRADESAASTGPVL